ncbi:MAG: hypothetical protein JWM57_1535 [Phycisphaerales bacterium]|nr:hypothetical protein [Phycisphaerales bacterium]
MKSHRVQQIQTPSLTLSRNTGRGDQIAALVAVFALTGSLHAAELDAALLKRLEAVDAKVAAVKDLAAKFEQKKFSPLLKKPITSTGTIRALGDAMLWLTESPEPTQLRIDGQTLQLLYVNQKSLEVYPLKGKMASMAASPLPRLATLKEKFDLAADPDAKAGELALVLTPKDPELKPFIDRVRVRLNEAVGVVERFELTDPDGERTEITFSDPKLNTGLAAKDLDLTPPAGTKTMRPLDPAAAP